MSVGAEHVVCPVCNALRGERCNVPTNDGRRTVSWYHLKRVDLAKEQK